MSAKFNTITLCILLFANFATAQNVGIGTATPAASAKLDITDANRGVLVPRVALTATNAAGPVTAPATSLLVYNTATAGTAPSNVTPGYYYNAGTPAAPNWLRFAVGNNNDWTILGNAGTNPTVNFIGTTDVQSFVLRTNNLERMRVLNTGQVAVNSTTTFVGSTFFSLATANNNAIDGNAAGTGAAVYGQNTGTGQGVYGLSNNAAGIGVIAYNISATGTGLLVSGNNSIPYTIPGGSGAALNGIPIGAVAYGNRLADGWGINAAGNDGNTSTILGGGGGSFSGRQWGVFSVATITGAGNNNTNRATFTGNYISAGTTGATVYVGARIGNVHYKILGTGGGSVSTTMATRDGEKILFAPESPENWFFDIGEVQLENGKSIVRLDPLFIDCISDSKPFKVFVQGAEGTFGNIKVSRNQEAKTFELEDTGGSSNGVVQFSIHGIWKSKENLRFPDFLPDYHHKTSEIQKMKIENNVELNVLK